MQFAEPNLQSAFKKPGGDTPEPSVWITLRGGVGEPELNGAEKCTGGRSIAGVNAGAVGDEEVVAKLLLSEPVGTGVEVIGELPDGAEVGLLSTPAQAGEQEVVKHSLVVRALYEKEWVVYSKEPFGGPEQVLKYLTGYTHRVALTNHRLVRLHDDRLTFTWKDYADGCRRREITLEAVEFVRRFSLHILPIGLVRIRQYGLLANRDRGLRLALSRSLLAVDSGPATAPAIEPPRPRGGSADHSPSQATNAPVTSLVEPKPASSSWLGMGVLAALLTLGISPASAAPVASSQAGDPTADLVEDRCPDCGRGQIRTIWQATRPGREERQRIPILDSS